MTAETEAEKKTEPGSPPEVDAELVSEPALDPPSAALSGPRVPRKGSIVPLAAAGAVVLAIAGGGYWALRTLTPQDGAKLSSDGAAPTAAGEAPAAMETPTADVPSAVTAPESTSGALPSSSPAGSGPTPDDGDALTPSPSGVAKEPAGLSSESAAGVSAPASAEAQTNAAETTAAPPQTAAADPLAQLQSAADALAADEANGLAAPATVAEAATTTAADPSQNVAGEVQALRALFESETKRLSDELAAERARADAQTQEIATLRANLASIDAAAPEPEAIAEAVPTSPAGSATKAVLTLLALTRAVESGTGFKTELARAEALAPGAPALEPLRIDAAEGLPTLAGLKDRFPAEARNALAASAGANDGLLGRFAAGVAEMVSVRPAGPVKGARTGAVLSRAEAALAGDDLEGALAELGGLQGPARESMAAFVADAGRLVSARKSLADLNLWFIENASG